MGSDDRGAAGSDPKARRSRDARVARRGLTAGGLVWVGLSAVLLTVTVRAGGTGQDGLVAVLAALVAGAVTASAWLLLAAVLDVLADEPPGRARLALTAAVVLVAVVSPLLVIGAYAAR